MPTAVLLYNCVHCILVQESALADIAAVRVSTYTEAT